MAYRKTVLTTPASSLLFFPLKRTLPVIMTFLDSLPVARSMMNAISKRLHKSTISEPQG